MKLIIDISNEEYTTLSKMSEKEKVNELSYYERAIANGIPYEERPQGEWIKGREISRTMLGSKVEHIDYRDYTCSNCGLVLDNLLYYHDGSPFYKFCPNCGAKMKGGAE